MKRGVWYFGAALPPQVRQVLSGGYFTGGAVELFGGGDGFGELLHLAEPVVRDIVRK
jgi:hypothetical protein